MKLRDIEIYIIPENNNLNDLGATARCIEDFFIKRLGGLETEKIAKINIFFTETDEFRVVEDVFNIIDLYIFFNFNLFYIAKDNLLKKTIVANSIVDNLIKLSNRKGWDTNKIIEAYNEIKKENFNNVTVFKKKFFKGKDSRFFFKLISKFDINDYSVYLELYDSKKKLIGERIVFNYQKKNFEIESAYWSDLNTFSIQFKGPKKVFKINIMSIINNEPFYVPEKLTDWFKD